MSENIIRDDNYYVVQGWMRNTLGLKGYALEIYAIIYGFSQVSHQEFTASINYLCEWLGASRPTVINTLKDLVEKGYLTKESEEINNVIYNRYRALTPSQIAEGGSKISLLGSKNSLLGGKNSLPNNIDNNIENKSLPKGKEEQAPKKSYNEIFEAKENEHIKDALVKFVNVCKGRNIKFQYKTLERWAKILRDYSKGDRNIALSMVNQSIDAGWRDIYPLKQVNKPQKQTAVYKPFNPETDTLATDENGNLIVY